MQPLPTGRPVERVVGIPRRRWDEDNVAAGARVPCCLCVLQVDQMHGARNLRFVNFHRGGGWRRRARSAFYRSCVNAHGGVCACLPAWLPYPYLGLTW